MTEQKRTRKTEADKAIEEFEKISRKMERKSSQYTLALAEAKRIENELDDLSQSRSFWMSHPAVVAHLEIQPQEKTSHVAVSG